MENWFSYLMLILAVFCIAGQFLTTKLYQNCVKQALISDDWDVVTLQQASHFSVDKSTYSPYAEEVAKYVKKYCPNAKIYIHQTWAYENGSDRLLNVAHCSTSEEMFEKINSIDIESLNLAIDSLSKVVEPLAKFFGVFSR